jgi:putative acyl-CoA dehydrogenase
MTTPGPQAHRWETHEVTNQSPPLEDYDLLATDQALVQGLEREGAGWARERVGAFGTLMGSAESFALGRDANRHPPELRTHDRSGHRVDEVEFHPAWHEVMRRGSWPRRRAGHAVPSP